MNYTSNLFEMMLIPPTKLMINLANLVITEATFFGLTTHDAMAHAGAATAIVLAFLLRIAMEWGKNSLSGKNVLIQAISTLALCFVAIYIWHDFLNYGKGFEIYVFFTALFAVFIVAEIEIVFKMGFRQRLKALLTKVLATDDKEIVK